MSMMATIKKENHEKGTEIIFKKQNKKTKTKSSITEIKNSQMGSTDLNWHEKSVNLKLEQQTSSVKN